MNKALQTRLFVFSLLAFLKINAQEKSLAYRTYDTCFVWFSDLGITSAPIRFKNDFKNNIKSIRLKNNAPLILGIGFSYKWLSLRVGFSQGEIRPISKFGKTQAFDFGVDFTIKNFFLDFDIHGYNGFAYKNANRWNDSLTALSPNELRPDIGAGSLSANTWHFLNKQFKMGPLRGKTANYVENCGSFYLKYTTNLHGIVSDTSILPESIVNATISKNLTRVMTAFDFGAIPGYGYVHRYKNIQLGAMLGAGFVIQTKFYETNSAFRGSLGLAPRIDFKFVGGINKPRYFIMFLSDLDLKSIRFGKLSYQQNFYNIRLVAGIRLIRSNWLRKSFL